MVNARHTTARRVLCAACAVAALCASLMTPTEAQAQDYEMLAQFSVGVKGGMNFNLLSEPSEATLDLPVPGFFGISSGFGLALEALAFDVVGMEVNVIFASTEGQGDIEFQGGGEINQKITSEELQIPVLLKAQLPFAAVRPFIMAGITFVRQSEAKFTVDANSLRDDEFDLEKNYSMLTVALGATINLPYVRIPIEFRGMYQELDDDPRERVEFKTSGNTITSMGVYPTWEGQIWIMTGISFSQGIKNHDAVIAPSKELKEEMEADQKEKMKKKEKTPAEDAPKPVEDAPAPEGVDEGGRP